MQYIYMITVVSGHTIASNSAELHSNTATPLSAPHVHVHTEPVQHDTKEGQGKYTHNVCTVDKCVLWPLLLSL